MHASSGRDYVSATGPTSKVQSAFGVQLNRYRVTGANGVPAVIQSTDRDVSVRKRLRHGHARRGGVVRLQ